MEFVLRSPVQGIPHHPMYCDPSSRWILVLSRFFFPLSLFSSFTYCNFWATSMVVALVTINKMLIFMDWAVILILLSFEWASSILQTKKQS